MNNMDTLVKDTLVKLMADKFSPRQQMTKLIEELGECTAAVSRYLRACDSDYGTSGAENHLIEEIIDVEFLFAQMRIYLNNPSVWDQLNEENLFGIKRRFLE